MLIYLRTCQPGCHQSFEWPYSPTGSLIAPIPAYATLFDNTHTFHSSIEGPTDAAHEACTDAGTSDSNQHSAWLRHGLAGCICCCHLSLYICMCITVLTNSECVLLAHQEASQTLWPWVGLQRSCRFCPCYIAAEPVLLVPLS